LRIKKFHCGKKNEDKLAENLPLVVIPKNSNMIPGVFIEDNSSEKVESPSTSQIQTQTAQKNNNNGNPILSDSSAVGPHQSRFAESQGIFDHFSSEQLGEAALGAAAVGAVAAGAMALSHSGKKVTVTHTPAPPPKSQYGVPSFADEECVICQYVTELTQRSLYDHLCGSTCEEYPHLSDIREINQQVMSMPNGRGIVRIVTENTVLAFCDPKNVPEIFYPYCTSLWSKIRSLSHALFFQYASGATCSEIKMCGLLSYTNEKTAVHLPNKSKLYNSGRGKCGMMGGVHEDSKSLIKSALCTAQKMLLN